MLSVNRMQSAQLDTRDPLHARIGGAPAAAAWDSPGGKRSRFCLFVAVAFPFASSFVRLFVGVFISACSFIFACLFLLLVCMFFFFVCSSLLSFVCECIYFRLWDSRVSLVSLLFLPCVHVCVYSHIWDSLPENRLFSLLSILSFVLLKVFMSVVCVCLRFCYFLLVFSA